MDYLVDDLPFQEEIQKARQAGLAYLSAQDRTVCQMRDCLEKKEFSVAAIDAAVADLERLNLLDDDRFARRWIESRLAGKPSGARKFRQDLRHRGVPVAVIDAVLEEFKDALESESAVVGLLVRQCWRYAGLEEQKAKRRMFGYLSRRGYDMELAKKAVDQVWEKMGAQQGQATRDQDWEERGIDEVEGY